MVGGAIVNVKDVAKGDANSAPPSPLIPKMATTAGTSLTNR
jgi:hypothetical protein